MMGRLNHDQGQLFYLFCLDEAVPDDHLVRQIAGVLDLSWVHYRTKYTMAYVLSNRGCRMSFVRPPAHFLTTRLLHLLRGCRWFCPNRWLAEPLAGLRRGTKHC
jgi:hypothetical protein